MNEGLFVDERELARAGAWYVLAVCVWMELQIVLQLVSSELFVHRSHSLIIS